jgi:predicted  nucleic acid-binding Zn-ribbon protein
MGSTRAEEAIGKEPDADEVPGDDGEESEDAEKEEADVEMEQQQQAKLQKVSKAALGKYTLSDEQVDNLTTDQMRKLLSKHGLKMPSSTRKDTLR